jgi:hypothetical protein
MKSQRLRLLNLARAAGLEKIDYAQCALGTPTEALSQLTVISIYIKIHVCVYLPSRKKTISE